VATNGRQRGVFPPGFLWGAATSAYQVEGAVDVDGRGRSIWDTFVATPGAVVAGDTGAVAADHYHRYREDVRLMAELGMRMYRFSVAWPRIQPTGRGAVNERGLDFYRRLVDALLEAGITPNLSLYHWDLPQALQDAGGWPARETALRFVDYAELVYEALHDRVPWWGTFNEPWCVALLGHAAGVHAPGIRDPEQAIRTIHHVLLAHGRAIETMRAIDPAPHLGIVLNLAPVRSATATVDPVVERGVRLIDGFRNRVWLESLFERRYPDDIARLAADHGAPLPVEDGDLASIASPIDWLGINYYNDVFVAARPGPDATNPWVEGVSEVAVGTHRTDSGWSITPSGLRDLLVSVGRDHPSAPPMLVTENGAAYDDPLTPDGSIDDTRRIAYLEQHLLAVSDAIADGADVRGYLVWSLLDNFEWAEGYDKRFGIIHVDFATLTRTPRKSAEWYRDVIARNAVGSPEAA
jgi:beta-glucosidase